MSPLLTRVHQLLRQNPPAGISAAYVDAFFARHQAAMEVVIHRRRVVPTDLNIWVLQEELKNAADGIIYRIPATAVPHLRRLIQAGWLEEVPGRKRHWRVSETGRAGMAARRKVDALPAATDAALIQACNVVSRRAGDRKGPELSPSPTAAQIQRWLRWNDPDGEWEFLSRADDRTALEVLRNSWEADDVAWWLRENSAMDQLPAAEGRGAQTALRFA